MSEPNSLKTRRHWTYSALWIADLKEMLLEMWKTQSEDALKSIGYHFKARRPRLLLFCFGAGGGRWGVSVWVAPTNNYCKEQIIRTIRKCNCFQQRKCWCWAETLCFPTIRPNSDPLAWWKAHVGDQPNLSTVARKYLCIPATTAPLERVFSSSGPTVKARHSEHVYAHISVL